MYRQDALQLLTEHQQKILGIMEDAEKLLLCGSAADLYRLSQMRWELLRMMTGYQYHKHHALLDPLIARGMPDQIQSARELKERGLRQGEILRAYVTRWTASGVCDWNSYKPEALELIKTMRLHIAREARALAMLIADPAYTRSLARAC